MIRQQRSGTAWAQHHVKSIVSYTHRAQAEPGLWQTRLERESALYSKELSLGNQPLETQRWILPQFLGNRLAGLSVSKKHTGGWKLSAGCAPSFLEIGWLAQELRFPTLSSLL